jgi:hypothetical protein
MCERDPDAQRFAGFNILYGEGVMEGEMAFFLSISCERKQEYAKCERASAQHDEPFLGQRRRQRFGKRPTGVLMRGHSGEAATEDARVRTHTILNVPSRGPRCQANGCSRSRLYTFVVRTRARLALLVIPRQKIAKGCSAMTVECLLFGAQLGEGSSDLRKVKHRIVTKSTSSQ